MIIKAIGFDAEWKAVDKNLKRLDKELKDSDVDLVVLPEMFATGFCMDTAELAPYAPKCLEWMQKKASELQAALCGTMIVKDGDNFFNRSYFVYPDQSFKFYDKKHLFSYAKENLYYSSGNKRVIVEYKGWRILLQICFDLRFPVYSRNTGDYDMVLYPACWPEKRILAWKTLLPARSIENQAIVVGANATGTDENGIHYPFSCGVWFPDGENICERIDNIWTAEISMENLEIFRKRFPFLKDADKFEIKS